MDILQARKLNKYHVVQLWANSNTVKATCHGLDKLPAEGHFGWVFHGNSFSHAFISLETLLTEFTDRLDSKTSILLYNQKTI